MAGWRHLVLALAVGGCEPPATEPPPVEVVGPTTGTVRLGPRAWRRSVADLLGVAEPTDLDLSALTGSARYENLGDLQVEGDLLVDRLVLATETVVERAVLAPELRADVASGQWDGGERLEIADGGGAVWWTTGSEATWTVSVDLPSAGTWVVEVNAVRAWRWVMDDDPPTMPAVEVTVSDGVSGDEVTQAVAAITPSEPETVTLTVEASAAGPRPIEVQISGHEVWGAAVSGIVVRRVRGGDGWLRCDGDEGPRACAESLLRPLIERAWLRPADDTTVGPLAQAVEDAVADGERLDEALAGVVERVLLSPEFLYRLEAPGTESGRSLSAWELAGRLADLLWASVPDDELVACAASGGLGADDGGVCGLDAQVDRMIAHPRLDGLIEVLVDDWLGVAALKGQSRDPERYGVFSEALAAAMREQTRRLLDVHVRDEVRFRDLFVRAEVEVNAPLAALYGVPAPEGAAWATVALPGADVGLLRQAAWLTATSQPDRTSPVHRGVAVLSNFLCAPPDPAPANIPALGEGADGREALDAHKTPGCAVCHDVIDPWGFALEGYDAIGAARATYEDGASVQTGTETVDGVTLDGLGGVSAALRGDPRVTPCFARQVGQIAVGRSWKDADEGWTDALAEAAGPDGSVLDVVRAMVRSPAFRARREVAE